MHCLQKSSSFISNLVLFPSPPASSTSSTISYVKTSGSFSIACMVKYSVSLRNGFFPLTNLYAVKPNDHTSHAYVAFAFASKISGAQYSADPTNEYPLSFFFTIFSSISPVSSFITLLLINSSLYSTFKSKHEPKSHNFTCPSDPNIIFSGFTSRCATRKVSWQYRNASVTSLM